MTLPSNLQLCRHDVAGALGHILGQHSFSKLCLLVDENTRAHCLPLIIESLPTDHTVVEIKSGEVFKTVDTCTEIWHAMTDARLDRHALFLNLGGGVIGDMGGFCAATYKRGIRFINLPTTLLAQVDASIGGKLGVDFSGLKNHIGLFCEPSEVLIHPRFIDTLPPRELLSGFAEVIKHALIRDAGKFEELEKHVDLQSLDWADIISHSVRIKQDVVEADPHEEGLRKILNYGHTVGHAVESHFLGKGRPKLLHGEAIAIGMICEALMAVETLDLDKDVPHRIANYIHQLYDLPVLDDEAVAAVELLTVQDKKNKGHQVRAALIDQIGSCVYDVEVSARNIRNAVMEYNRLLV